ncbi:MAG: hypothetical protein V4710_22650, partial [Verrucomicrobiota bacterium]
RHRRVGEFPGGTLGNPDKLKDGGAEFLMTGSVAGPIGRTGEAGIFWGQRSCLPLHNKRFGNQASV